jgi:hypothetical protein
MHRVRRRLVAIVPVVLVAVPPVAAVGCGAKSLVGAPCDNAGEEICEELALLRCDGTRYALLADCHHECVTADAVVHEQGTIETDETWTCAAGPHVVNGRFAVGPGVTLTIEPGASVRLNPSSFIDVDPEGRVVVDATSGAPVLLTSNDGQQAGFGAPAVGAINVFASAGGLQPSLLRHVIVERGYNGLGVFGLSATRVAPTVENCTMRDNQDFGIVVRCAEFDAPIPDFAAAGNQFFENGEGDVSPCDPG